VPWSVLDYQVFRSVQPFVTVDDGVQQAQIQLPTAVPADQVWRIERVNCYVSNNPLPEEVGGGLAVPFLVQIYDQVPIQVGAAPCDQTWSGVFDVADNSQPITLRESDMATFLFTCFVPEPISAQASIRCQYHILGGSASSAPTPVAGAGGGPAIPVNL
jgi:hypothetical protein